ncbi:Hpt domain-containing protein [Pirellulaceae bacterium SH501]
MNATLHSPLANDPDFHPVLVEFVSELPERSQLIRSTLGGKDLPALRRVAHQLKGAFGGYGYPALTNLAADVERLIDTGEGIREITYACERLLDGICMVSAEPETI